MLLLGVKVFITFKVFRELFKVIVGVSLSIWF